MARALAVKYSESSDVTINLAELVTEDDKPVDNLFSEKQQRLLTEPLYSSWTGPRDLRGKPRKFLAAANVGLFPALHQAPLVPDVFLSLDVQVAEDWYQKNHRTYFFWEFGKPPEVAIEIVSNRKGQELGSKLNDYARIRIPYYVVYDPTQLVAGEPLLVYELIGSRYQLREDFKLPDVGLALKLWTGKFEGKKANWLRWCDSRHHMILTGAERADRSDERALLETQRAESEKQRAESEKQRADRLAAKLRALGLDPDEV